MKRQLATAGHRNVAFACVLTGFMAAFCAVPATAASSSGHDSAVARQMSDAFESLASRISPAVVEVLVSGYDTEDEENQNPDAPIGRQSSLGSGVIVDPNGYIVTNYHVIKGAQRVNVVITPAIGTQSQAPAALRVRARTLPAKIVGYNRTADLAVLKVDATGLPTVPFAKYAQLQQGQLVLAVGSPEGMQNSVTMGLVSAVLRQIDPESPMVYIQTDAAINPGNSGGALVDVDGNLVGLNVSILTKSGGSEGIGFAIPSAIVRFVYQQIRQYGYVRSGDIGADVQTITPALASALALPSDTGVIVSDVAPEGPAARAGLRPYDRIQTLDGTPIDSVSTFVMSIYLRKSGDRVDLEVLRGNKKMSLTVPVVERKRNPASLLDLANPDKDLVAQLGIVGIDLTPRVADLLSEQRTDSGVVVAATTTSHRAEDIGLQYGDIIHSLNTDPVGTVTDLRAALKRCTPGNPAALRIERDGRMTFLTFEIE
ncbi:MAG: trypsin-like peptidase domain-containing protein [Rhodanobacteraceae bacterium]